MAQQEKKQGVNKRGNRNGFPSSRSANYQNRKDHSVQPRLIYWEQDRSVPRNFPMVKSVWAPYVNMARQNIFQTLCHISHVLGLDINAADEENLLDIPVLAMLNKKGRAEQKVKAMRMIEKHFPFINPMVERLIVLRFGKEDKNGEYVVPQEKKEKTSALYYEVFEIILPLINLYRNYFSHYLFVSDRIDENGKLLKHDLCEKAGDLALMLDYTITGARRIVKTRYNVKEEPNGASQNDKDIIFSKTDFEYFEGKTHYYDHINTDENNMSKVEKGKECKVKRERKDYIYRVSERMKDESHSRLTNMGLYLFICLFLTKKYAKEFGDKTDFWGKTIDRSRPSDRQMLIMHETSCVYRMHQPKNRLHSEKDESALGLDILGELKKCPRELYDTLSLADQNKFRVKKSEKDDHANDESLSEEMKADDGTVLMLRSHDRFPNLSLQYLDSMKRFSAIRFQVDLGNYRYKFYEKKGWVDTPETQEDRVRILQKEMIGYGRLAEIEQERKTRWEGLIRVIDKPRADTKDSKPYITDHHASYHIENNHIGLQWNEKGRGVLDRSGIFMPQTNLPEWVTNENTLKRPDNAADIVAPCIPPKCWLSVYDLPAVCFLTYLSGSGERAEKIIIDTTNNFFKLYQDINEGKLKSSESIIPSDIRKDIVISRAMQKSYSYILKDYNLNISDLPSKIQDYLLDISAVCEELSNDIQNKCVAAGVDIPSLQRYISSHKSADVSSKQEELAKKKLELMLFQSRRRLNRFTEDYKLFATKDNKLGKKKHVDIRQGTLARFLAKDMMFFKEPDADGKVKLTSQNFNILQAELALYRMSLDELTRFLRNCDLLGGNHPHPFLQNVVDRKPRNFYQFYTYYLEEREKTIEKLINDKSYSQLHFMHPDREKWQQRNDDFYKKLAGKYTTIELPGGIFLDAIVGELEKLQDAYPGIKDALASERKNVSFLIGAYMNAIGSGSQSFYGNSFKRNYKYFCMVNNPKFNNKKLENRYMSVEEMESFMSKSHDRVMRDKAYYRLLEDQKTIDLKSRPKKRSQINQEYDEACNAAEAKLQKAYRFYTENEKAIRRQKMQDGLLFLMAQDVLTEKMKIGDWSAYKLSNIGCGEEGEDILSQQLPFSIKLEVPTDEGIKSVTIHQDNLKLKNYGDFFRFIYDSRIKPLLSQTNMESIDREHLELELDRYDQRRIPLFELVHQIEGKVVNNLSEKQLHPMKEGKAIKVDFKYLLQFVDIEESNKETLRIIRNAFCHSTYPERSRVQIVLDKKSDIPQVAETLVNKFKDNASI